MSHLVDQLEVPKELPDSVKPQGFGQAFPYFAAAGNTRFANASFYLYAPR
jgi:hypothetical protein